jgi:hypothetical protein
LYLPLGNFDIFGKVGIASNIDVKATVTSFPLAGPVGGSRTTPSAAKATA